MKNIKNYKAIEDNGGGLALVVFDQDEEKIEYIHTGYEYNPGQLSEDLDRLESGDDPAKEWDGNDMASTEKEDPEELGSWFPEDEEGIGWDVVADNSGIYPENMGEAGTRELIKNAYGFPPEYILQDDGCTRKEAKDHLSRGTTIYIPEEYALMLSEMEDSGEYFEDMGIDPEGNILEQVQKYCREGRHKGDTSFDNVQGIPYVIEYVL